VDVTLVVDALGPQLSGIGRYTWELCRRVPDQPGIGRVGFFANGRFVDDPECLMRDQPTRSRRRLPRWARRRLVRRRLRNSLVHGPNYFLPPDADGGIITVHDLSVLRYPETHPSARVKAFERQFESSLARASHVITDSETVRSEVIADLGLAASKVTAIHLGVGSEYRPRSFAEIEPVLASLGLKPGEYALCVSTLEPRKKIAELIGAWRELPAGLRNATPLVLAGAKGWLNDQLHDEIEKAVAEGWLKHPGFVPEPLLLALYAGASLFLYPSSYEGFGLPPLEAMASGVPVLVANRSCLPEISGDAAGYVDPDDQVGFSAAIAEALTDSAWRIRAREKGLERAAAFSWDKCASETAELYLRCAP
jgi:glycosyltransferase involved in cell wall biosynthesis